MGTYFFPYPSVAFTLTSFHRSWWPLFFPSILDHLYLIFPVTTAFWCFSITFGGCHCILCYNYIGWIHAVLDHVLFQGRLGLWKISPVLEWFGIPFWCWMDCGSSESFKLYPLCMIDCIIFFIVVSNSSVCVSWYYPCRVVVNLKMFLMLIICWCVRIDTYAFGSKL